MALEVLEYVRSIDLEKAIEEVLRVLKRGGYCFLGVPFMCAEHGDRIRPTLIHLEEILKAHHPSRINVHKIGNAYAVCWDLLRQKVLRLKPAILKKLLLAVGITCFHFIAKLSRLDQVEDDCYLGVYIAIQK
jgi:hypothetical protein